MEAPNATVTVYEDRIFVEVRSVTQSYPTLCDPMDCSPPGSPSMEFSRQEHWSGLPFPPPGDLLDPRMEPASLASPTLASRFFTTASPGKPFMKVIKVKGEHKGGALI